MKKVIIIIIAVLGVLGLAVSTKTETNIGQIEAYVYAAGSGGYVRDGIVHMPNGIQTKIRKEAKYSGMYSSTLSDDDIDYEMYFPITTNKTLSGGEYVTVDVIQTTILGFEFNTKYVVK